MRSSKDAPRQPKHVKPAGRAHAAHQQAPGRATKGNEKNQTAKTGHPVEHTPRAPRKGQ